MSQHTRNNDPLNNQPLRDAVARVNLALYDNSAPPRIVDIPDQREVGLVWASDVPATVQATIAPGGRTDTSRSTIYLELDTLREDPGRCAAQIQRLLTPPTTPKPGVQENAQTEPAPAEQTLRRPLIGVRTMAYDRPTGLLGSAVHSHSGLWDGSQMVMHCSEHGHTEPPITGCGCGLYAYDSYESLAEDDAELAGSPAHVRCVVKGHGPIVEAERGFVAQRMKPLALVFDHPNRTYFGVELPVLGAFEALAERLSVALIHATDIPRFARNQGIYAADRNGPSEHD